MAVLLGYKVLETTELVTSRNCIDLCIALLFLERAITVPKPLANTWNRGAEFFEKNP